MRRRHLRKNSPQTRWALAVVLALLLLALVTPVVSAHATLVRSDPADGSILAEPPHEIRLWYDETISSQFSSAQLFDANSQPVEITGVHADADDPKLLILTLPELEPGVYSVLWKVFSEADGHFSQGLLVFGVGEEADLGSAAGAAAEPAAPPAAEVVLRWLNFSLLAGLVGAVAIVQLVLNPLGHRSETPLADTARRAAQRRVLGWAVLCAGLALLVGGGLLLWQALTLLHTLPEGASLPGVAWQVLGRTRWGALWLARQALLAVLGGTMYLARRATRKDGLLVVAGVLSLALMAVQALTGHAAAVTPITTLALVVDAIHLVAASFWVGGLLALIVGLLPTINHDRGNFTDLVRAGWRPFSRLAALSVALLFASGLYNTGRQVASVDALITTLYGQALMAKIGLMLAVGLFGLVNSSLLHPHLAAPLARLLRRPPGWTPLSLRRLPALVLAEVSLGLLVLLATGLITASAAPRSLEYTVAPESVPTALSQSADDVVVTLMVKPNRPGRNVFTVFAASTRRPPPAEIMRVILRFTYLEQDMGRVSITAEEVEPGRYLVTGSDLSLAGPWQVDVVVRRKGVEDSVARLNWVVAPPGESRPVVVSKQPIEAPLTIAAAGVILALLLVVAGLRLGRDAFRKFIPGRSDTDSDRLSVEISPTSSCMIVGKET